MRVHLHVRAYVWRKPQLYIHVYTYIIGKFCCSVSVVEKASIPVFRFFILTIILIVSKASPWTLHCPQYFVIYIYIGIYVYIYIYRYTSARMLCSKCIQVIQESAQCDVCVLGTYAIGFC